MLIKRPKRSNKKRKNQKENEIDIFENVPSISDILLPEALEEKRDYLYLGYNKYSRIFVMTIYPSETWVSWLDDLTYIGDITICTKIEPAPSGSVINQLTRKLVQNQSEYVTYSKQRQHITFARTRKANSRP